MTSNEPLPDRCAAGCRDGEYCENYPVTGSQRCRMHGGSGSGAPCGEANGNYEHGGYSQEWLSSLDRWGASTYPELVGIVAEEIEAFDSEREAAAAVASELLVVRFHRAEDPEFLLGFRTVSMQYLWSDDEGIEGRADELAAGRADD